MSCQKSLDLGSMEHGFPKFCATMGIMALKYFDVMSTQVPYKNIAESHSFAFCL